MITMETADTLAANLRRYHGIPLQHAFIRFGRFSIEYRNEITGPDKWEVKEGAAFRYLQPTLEKALMVLSELSPGLMVAVAEGLDTIAVTDLRYNAP